MIGARDCCWILECVIAEFVQFSFNTQFRGSGEAFKVVRKLMYAELMQVDALSGGMLVNLFFIPKARGVNRKKFGLP